LAEEVAAVVSARLVVLVALAQPKADLVVPAQRKVLLVDLELPKAVPAVLVLLRVALVVQEQPKAVLPHLLSRQSFSAAMARSTT
jgi:hypothetical protein